MSAQPILQSRNKAEEIKIDSAGPNFIYWGIYIKSGRYLFGFSVEVK